MQLSHFQEALIDATKNSQQSLLVEAVAGSGKSTTLVLMSKELPATDRIAFLAFGKENAETLKQRVPSHVLASTVHSLGFRPIRQRFQSEVDSGKVFKLSKTMFPDADLEVMRAVRKMVSLAKAYGYGYYENGEFPLQQATYDHWRRLADYHDVYLQPNDIDFACHAADVILQENNQIVSSIDYDDMIYFPVIFSLSLDGYSTILTDETQDLNITQRALIHGFLQPGGRLIAVGDRRQAIYSWRGADSASMDAFKHEFNCTELPLSITYRCPKLVVAEAKKLVPQIEAAPNAIEGEIKSLSIFGPRDLTEGSMIICRNNAPLFRLALKLLRARIPFRMLGRDIVEGLKGFIKNFKAADLSDLSRKLQDWKAREVAKCINEGHEMKAQDIADRAECILSLASECPQGTVDALLALIDDLFRPNSPHLTLSSGHRAKGLEQDKIFFLEPNLIPSPFAKQQWQKEMERNLLYVMLTRPKFGLYYVTVNGFRA